MTQIELKNVSYQYPTGKEESLKNVNLTIEKGSFYSIVGENGSGKTTLCNVLRGFIPHFFRGELKGEVLINGTDIREWDMGELAQHVGFVFQNPFTQISGVKETVFEEIAFGLENLGTEPSIIREKVQDVLNLLDLNHLSDKNPIELSGGQKQKVALASIIVMEPDMLIIDEPTSQLDPQATEDVFKIIEIMKNKGITIVLVEHKIELIAEYADYIIVLKDGEVVQNGTTREILSDEKTLENGAALPQYALLSFELQQRNIRLDRIPIRTSEAVTSMKSLLEGDE